MVSGYHAVHTSGTLHPNGETTLKFGPHPRACGPIIHVRPPASEASVGLRLGYGFHHVIEVE